MSINYRMRKFWIRLLNYEYWPMWAFYLPLIPYLLAKGILNRHLFFYTNVNHGLDGFGGLIFESKSQTDDRIQENLRAKTILITKGLQVPDNLASFKLPLVIKPDNGERGKGIHFINSYDRLKEYFPNEQENYLIQEFVDFPMEFGVFVAYNPENTQHEIISLTQKCYYTVKGNGVQTISELIKRDDRGVVFYEQIAKLCLYPLDLVPLKGEELVLHRQGNHSKGTQFIDVSDRITEKMRGKFNEFLSGIPDFEYGRFDLKCCDYSDLESFERLKMIEFNGISAEPISIYDQRTGFVKSLMTFVQHWKNLEKLSKFNRKKGVKAYSTATIIKRLFEKIGSGK